MASKTFFSSTKRPGLHMKTHKLNSWELNRNRIFIVMKAADRKGFARQEDRDYFAKPVEVVASHCNVLTKALYVTDPVRGHTYPVCGDSLRSYYQLTKRQLEEVHGIAKQTA